MYIKSGHKNSTFCRYHTVRSHGETATLNGAHCICAGPQREQRKVQRNLDQNVAVKQY